jgi:hypothetical protein
MGDRTGVERGLLEKITKGTVADVTNAQLVKRSFASLIIHT